MPKQLAPANWSWLHTFTFCVLSLTTSAKTQRFGCYTLSQSMHTSPFVSDLIMQLLCINLLCRSKRIAVWHGATKDTALSQVYQIGQRFLSHNGSMTRMDITFHQRSLTNMLCVLLCELVMGKNQHTTWQLCSTSRALQTITWTLWRTHQILQVTLQEYQTHVMKQKLLYHCNWFSGDFY